MIKDIIQETCNNTVLWMLVAVITFDYITGVIKGALWKVNDSQVGMKGLIKHGLVLAGFLVVPSVIRDQVKEILIDMDLPELADDTIKK